MKKEFAIYKTETFELRSPYGLRQVKVQRKENSHFLDIPPESEAEIDSHKEVNADLLFEGTGNVFVQTPQGVYPQPITFLFGPEIKDAKTAFDHFESYMSKEVDRIREEQMKNSLIKANANDLKNIDEAARKAGIIIP